MTSGRAGGYYHGGAPPCPGLTLGIASLIFLADISELSARFHEQKNT